MSRGSANFIIPPATIVGVASLAVASVWLGGAAALVTAYEIDRRLHPDEYPLPYEIVPEISSDEPAPSAEPTDLLEAPRIPVSWCAL